MAFKRFLIEIGQGVDMHGGDTNNAVLKATKDAIHHCCIPGLQDIFGMEPGDVKMRVKADVYVPCPEDVDPGIVKDYLKMYEVEVAVHKGGADPEGIHVAGMGDGSTITIALVVLTVYVDVPE